VFETCGINRRGAYMGHISRRIAPKTYVCASEEKKVRK